VVAAVDAGMTQPRAADRFAVLVHPVERYSARRPRTASVAAAVSGTGRRRRRSSGNSCTPGHLTASTPAADAMLAQHVAVFVAAGGEPVSLASMSRAINSLPAPDPGQALTATGRRRRPGRR
jgi:hypothetical protein